MPMTYALATHDATNVLHTLRRRLTFNNPGTTLALTVGVLPPGSVVVSGGLNVTTAFNGATTDLVDVGISTPSVDANEYASALDVATVGFKPFDDLASVSVGYNDSLPITVTATYTDASANATAGVADVVVNYVIKPAT